MTSEQYIDKLYKKFSGNGVCRICWRSSANLSTMTDVSMQHLNEICGIKVPQRTIPYKMCTSCRSKLYRAVQFKGECHETGAALLRWVQEHGEGKDIEMDSNTLFNLFSSFRQMDILSKSETLAVECLENCSNSTGQQYLTIYSHWYRKPPKISSNDDPLSDTKDIKPNDAKLDKLNSNYITVKSEIISTEYQRSDGQENHQQKNQLKLNVCQAFETDAKAADSQKLAEVKIEFGDIGMEGSSDGEVISAAAVAKAKKAGRKVTKKGKSSKKEGVRSRCLEKERHGSSLDSEPTDGEDGEGSEIKKNERCTNLEITVSRTKVKPSRVVYNAFDPTKATIIKLSPEQQRSELEQIRRSDKFLAAQYRCEPCAKYYVTEIGLRQHMDKHEGGKLACAMCSLTYSSVRPLRTHERTHSERYACKRCPSVFFSRTSVLKHVVSHDDAAPTFVCSICGKINICMRSHKIHEKLHANRRPYKCDRCPRDFTHSTSRSLHIMRVHTNARPFACPVCPSVFVTSAALQAHSQKHSTHQAHYCVECNMRFKSAVNLTRHLTDSSRHALTSTLRFSCDECDARYATRPFLLDHVQTVHVRSASHKCPTCSKAFHTANALRHHRHRIHARGERPRRYKCDLCDKAFTASIVLKHHRMIHTGERPYSCPTCTKTFRQKAALWTHNKQVHNHSNKDTASQPLPTSSHN